MRDLEFDIRAPRRDGRGLHSARRRSRDFIRRTRSRQPRFAEAASPRRGQALPSAIRSGGHETANLAAPLHDVGVRSPAVDHAAAGRRCSKPDKTCTISIRPARTGAVALLRGAFRASSIRIARLRIALQLGGDGRVCRRVRGLSSGFGKQRGAPKRRSATRGGCRDQMGSMSCAIFGNTLPKKQRLSSETAIGEATGAVAAPTVRNAARQQVGRPEARSCRSDGAVAQLSAHRMTRS